MTQEVPKFEREERYIVVKRKHLTAIQETALRAHLARLEVETIESAVIESDWPEYEPVWQMIEARVTGSALTSSHTEAAELNARVERYRDALEDIRDGDYIATTAKALAMAALTETPA